MDESTFATISIAGAVAVIGAIAAGIVSIISAVHATRQGMGDVNQKLDTITVLVDGRYSEVLNELAMMKELLARRTGNDVDIEAAKTARVAATEQDERVERAEHKKAP